MRSLWKPIRFGKSFYRFFKNVANNFLVVSQNRSKFSLLKSFDRCSMLFDFFVDFRFYIYNGNRFLIKRINKFQFGLLTGALVDTKKRGKFIHRRNDKKKK